MSAMPALLSSSRLPLLFVVTLAYKPIFCAASSTPQPASILRLSNRGLRIFSSKKHLLQDLIRGREREHMLLMMRRGLEALVAGVALVLMFANFLSPGWTNLPRVHTSYPPRAAVSRAFSMATPDAAPSIVVYVTVPNKETGTKLAHSIIENKLAACVNQIPGVESTYWWEGKVETDTEILLMIKTRQALLGELTDHVKNNHPYDTPEVIAVPITGGSEKYLKWIGDNTKEAELV